MGHPKKKNPIEFKKKKFERPPKNNQKRGRLIVRNLPFKTTEENLREHFAKFGDVKDIKLLRRADNKLIGCGFVEFNVVQNAAKALYHCTGKEFLGRPIICDWAVSKDRYVDATKHKVKQEKKETDESDENVVKDEPMDEDDVKVKVEDSDVKEESDSEEEEVEEKPMQEDTDDDDEEEDDDDGDSSEDDEEGSVNKKENKDVLMDATDKSEKTRYCSNDVSEGKTVFVKNVPFSATNEDLKKLMRQFGPVYYALVCIDHLTEHSKGTAFVKFVNQEDAEKCLQAGTELKLKENILDCHRALGKNDLENKNKIDKNSKAKDSRNLYLIKEGVILAGSKSAEGVSASDMAKRLQLEQHKTQMLKNLNMFISRVRLIIHNLPANWDDIKLRTLLKKYTGPKTVIREAKVMRDLKSVDAKGVGKSKEFGFVAFQNHEDALKALRSLNNNPNIFSKAKRPIVGFSIENKVMVNARQKRLLKSQLKNPKSKLYNPEEVKKSAKVVPDERVSEFSGTAATPGIKKLRTKFSLKKQAEMHHQQLKDAKRRQKFSKKTLAEKRQDFIRQPKQKINKNPKKRSANDDNFSKLVNKYKSNLMSISKTKKSKWYDQ